MTVEDLINALSQFPKDLDLSEVKVMVGVEKEIGWNRIQCVYIADKRIAGGHPWGRLQHMERQTNLEAVATSLLQGLKLNKNGAKS